MTDSARTPSSDATTTGPLRLKVGCAFGLETTHAMEAVLQVAPIADPNVEMRHESWYTDARHHGYLDGHGNRCERLTIPGGVSRLLYDAEVEVADPSDPIDLGASETPIEDLPDDVLRWLMPSRFCLPDELGSEAWDRFAHLDPGGARVQAIVDDVHDHLEFLPGSSNPWTTAADAFRAGQGVCRDFAHLAITYCRALNIPARYVFGYIPVIGVEPLSEEMDFAAWFEVWLDGRWHTFDARNNRERIGRVVVGRGRDAVDVALITSFGALTLTEFKVIAEPVADTGLVTPAA